MATLRPCVAQFAREFFHDRRLAGAADGEIADGDDLHAERGVAQDADVVKKAAGLDAEGWAHPKFPYAPLVAKLLRLVSDTAALRRQVTATSSRTP